MKKENEPNIIVASKPIRDKRGRHGVRIAIEITDSPWHGRYEFTTHGMHSSEVAAKRDAIIAHHEKISARLVDFAAVLGSRTIAGDSVVVRDCTIRERGTNVELFVSFINADGTKTRIRRIYRDIDAVPSNAEINQTIRDSVIAAKAAQRDANDHVAAVRRVLGVENGE